MAPDPTILVTRVRERFLHALLTATRVWLPIAIAVAGVVLIVLGGAKVHGAGISGGTLAGAGVALLVIAVMVWTLNWLLRLSISSSRDRDREEEARRFFDEHGRWPDAP
jgi:drug/metabolite transporter (DMT)-like permease